MLFVCLHTSTRFVPYHHTVLSPLIRRNDGLNLSSPREISRILQQNGLSPLKKFGQNFLCDDNVINKIADSVGAGPDDYVLEIGTGLGALTAALAKRARRVVSVEIDRGLIASHSQTLAEYSNIEIIEGDILTVDLASVGKTFFSGQKFFVCGNLPYYITSKILLHLLESGAPILSATVMVQKEVGERLCADAGDTDYGALTASCRYYTKPKILFAVSHRCFYPAPDVDSVILQLDLSAPPFSVPRAAYTRVVRSAFAMRRKTVFNNLKQLTSPQKTEQALLSCGISPSSRAQDITPQQFCALTQYFLDIHAF